MLNSTFVAKNRCHCCLNQSPVPFDVLVVMADPITATINLACNTVQLANSIAEFLERRKQRERAAAQRAAELRAAQEQASRDEAAAKQFVNPQEEAKARRLWKEKEDARRALHADQRKLIQHSMCSQRRCQVLKRISCYLPIISLFQPQANCSAVMTTNRRVQLIRSSSKPAATISGSTSCPCRSMCIMLLT